MALVTLTQAKDHLRIDATDADNDIALKLAQAEAIILNYLTNRLKSIASVSVANPTVITTTVAHGFTSGVTAPILGTTTTPTVNGAQVITVTGPTTFTVPVNVTVGQSSEAGTVGNAVWTDLTVPGNVTAAILILLTHLHEHRGDDQKTDEDLWASIARLLVRHRDPALA